MRPYQSVLHHPRNNRLHHFDRNVLLKQIQTFIFFIPSILYVPYILDYINYTLMVPLWHILSFFFIPLAFSTKIPHYLCTFNILLNHYIATVFSSILKILHFFLFHCVFCEHEIGSNLNIQHPSISSKHYKIHCLG